MDYKTIESLKEYGFEGFKKISDLFKDTSLIPFERGIYFVLYLSKGYPEFLSKGVGGYFKAKDPNVSEQIIRNNWVKNTIVVYIGQAGGIRAGKWSNQTINKRISDYMKFGKGNNIGHYGGRYIWQLKDYKETTICWKSLPNKTIDPKSAESQLISNFKNIYDKRPFANLQG